MIKIYKFTEKDDMKVIAKYDHNDEYKAINQYIKDKCNQNTKINIFAEHSKTVYAMHFYLISNGIKEEYMLIQFSLNL